MYTRTSASTDSMLFSHKVIVWRVVNRMCWMSFTRCIRPLPPLIIFNLTYIKGFNFPFSDAFHLWYVFFSVPLPVSWFNCKPTYSNFRISLLFFHSYPIIITTYHLSYFFTSPYYLFSSKSFLFTIIFSKLKYFSDCQWLDIIYSPKEIVKGNCWIERG